jgi:hypothetical protein
MRPASNLKARPEYAVKKAELRNGFLAFYNSRLGISGYEFMFRAVTAVLYPESDFEGEAQAKMLKKLSDDHFLDKDAKHARKSTLRLDSATKSFEFRVPVFRQVSFSENLEMPNSLYAVLYALNKAWTPSNQKTSVREAMQRGLMSGAELATKMKVKGHAAACAAEAIKQVEVTEQNGYVYLWFTFRISQTEAEYLNNTPLFEIKLGNFYPSLLLWASGTLGEDVRAPVTITPIAAIAREVKNVMSATPVKPRVGLDDMVKDINNNIYVIPEVDNSAMYEQRLMDFGLKDGGFYTWGNPGSADEANGKEIVHEVDTNSPREGKTAGLPANMPIFTDWLNDKFAYSNSVGNLAVYDLSDTVPVKALHLLQVLNTGVNAKATQAVVNVMKMALSACYRYDKLLLSETPNSQEIAELEKMRGQKLDESRMKMIFTGNVNDFETLINRALMFHQLAIGNVSDFFVLGGVPAPRVHQLHHEKGLITLRFVGRIFKKALDMLEGNLEAMYRLYSVLTVLQQLAVLRVLVKHAPTQPQLTEADLAERDAYVNQGVDPEHKVEPVALVKKDMKFMPHQAKCDNLMRRHPKSAVYAVSAGGGKTILIMTNILREIKDGVCKKALVLCPPHLVAQYIEEVVYVTEGRLNVIPITNVSFKSQGEEQLTKMITAAPPNTLFVSDYDFVKGRSEEVSYGNKSVTVYRNAEWMRTFEFDLVALDECHYLKNSTSARRQAVARLIQDIPYKRLASGTFVADTLKDVVSQIALIDPTLFGSEEHFKAEFAGETRGAKVVSWRDGAEREVAHRIRQHVVWAEAKRKEWAALLPTPKERFIYVSLTENQRLLYESILEETTRLIQEALAKRPDLKDAMDQEDDTKDEELERLLRPYMARLEKFLSAPETDAAGEIFLKDPEDRVSPKLKKMYEIIQKHRDEGITGKVLVFTMYLPTAESAYLNAPSELQQHGIHYTADNKLQCRAEFENDDDKFWMVGQSSSMDTGLNFQFVSRLIRLETVWTPGVLEQGNSRINRPQLKKEERRDKIYFDWIAVNQSVDVTKISRLIAKVISKGKFDEHDNPRFTEIANLEQIPITLESIAANNDFHDRCLDYMKAYQEFQQAQEAEFIDYREKHGDEIEPVPVASAGMLDGSKLMARVPYVPGMNVYGTEQLGLLRYDQFVRQDIDTVEDSEIEEEENGNGEGEEEIERMPDGKARDPKQAVREYQRMLRAKERVLAKNRAVHTEYGDGEITAIGNKFVRIRLNNGSRARLEKMKVFIITRSTTNAKDMRNELLKKVQGGLPIDAPIEVPVEKSKKDLEREAKRKGKEPVVKSKESPQVALSFSVINDMLFLVYNSPDSSGDTAMSILQNIGFQIAPEYKFARLVNHRQVIRVMRAWADAGFKIDKSTSTQIKEVFERIKVNINIISKFGFSTSMDFRNFYREEIKPSASPTDIKVYPQVQDGQLYFVLPTRGQTANLKAVRVPVTNIKWRVGGGSNELMCHLQSKEQGKQVLKQIMERGVQITNLDELKEQYIGLKMGKKTGKGE